ncbi:hypothetical protein K1719_014969 [Acacia pycnantha]|nr:hypothetical protein K1719_014969 [Acacia pycnantha]
MDPLKCRLDQVEEKMVGYISVHVRATPDPQNVSPQPPQQPPTRLSVNTPATTTEESFGPWMLNARFAALEDLENKEETLMNHSARRVVHHRPEQPEKERTSSVKMMNSERKRETTGKMRIKGVEINAKFKTQYRAKGVHSSDGPTHELGPNCLVEDKVNTPMVGPDVMKEDNILLKANGDGPGPSGALDKPGSSKSLDPPNEDRSAVSNEIVLHVGHKICWQEIKRPTYT